MVGLSMVIDLLSLELVLAVIGEGGGDCGSLGSTAAVRSEGVPDPHGVDEMGTRGGRSNDASARGNDGGSCLVSSGVDPGSGGGSPCGGRGPAPYSPRDPFADIAWGVWVAGGVSETTARMFVLCLRWGEVVVGLVLIVMGELCAVLRGSLILVMRKRGGLALEVGMLLLLTVAIVTVLIVLVMTLVRVEVCLVVGGALALPSLRDPFADNALGVWRAGGGSQKPLLGCWSLWEWARWSRWWAW